MLCVPVCLPLLCAFRFADPSMWTVHVGRTEQPGHGAQPLAVEQIIYHARYRPKGLDYDIALMRLTTSLVFNGTDVIWNTLQWVLTLFLTRQLLYVHLYTAQRCADLFYCICFSVRFMSSQNLNSLIRWDLTCPLVRRMTSPNFTQLTGVNVCKHCSHSFQEIILYIEIWNSLNFHKEMITWTSWGLWAPAGFVYVAAVGP